MVLEALVEVDCLASSSADVRNEPAIRLLLDTVVLPCRSQGPGAAQDLPLVAS